MAGASAELTCGVAAAARGPGTPCVYAGDRGGRVRALPLDETARGDRGDVRLDRAAWTTDTGGAAITSICAARDAREEPLLAVGGASGELVFLRGDRELRRLRLGDAAVRCVAYARDDEFIAADQRGALYGVTRYEVLWKEELPGVGEHEAPLVEAITPVRLLDVQSILSSYVLVSTGRRELLLTHQGKVFATVSAPTAVRAIAVWSGEDAAASEEDLVLAAGHEGVVYKLKSVRDKSAPYRPEFSLTLEPWTKVAFPIAKLFVLGRRDGGDVTWLCLGVHGDMALFHDKELQRQWHPLDAGAGLPVDYVLLDTSSAACAQVAVVLRDSVQLVSIEL